MPLSIQDQVARAFQKTPKPGSDELTRSRGDEELEDTAQFRDLDWNSIEHDVIEKHYYALFWFTEQAFHYYLPAFLLAAIETPRSTFVITLVLLLKPNKDKTKEVFRRERWSMLNATQVEALETWLARLHELAPADGKGELEDALRVVRSRYWWQ